MSEAPKDRVTLFVQEWDRQAEALKVTPVRPVASDIELDKPLAFHIPPKGANIETPTFITTSRLDRFYIARRPEAEKPALVLEQHVAFQDQRKQIATQLGEIYPASLLATDRGCWVGSVGRIDWVDFDSEQPRARMVYAPDLEVAETKAIDAMVNAGDLVIAVDNVTTPKFAFVFDPQPNGDLSLRYQRNLPDHADEKCRQAAASPTKLAIRTSFYSQAGAGQRLLLFDVGSDRLKTTAQATEIRGTGMLKAGRSRLAGHTHSNWEGLGVVGAMVVIGAGERGILVCSTGMGDEDRATRVDLAGSCLDLRVVRRRVYALVVSGKGKKQRTQLVVLKANTAKTTLELTATYPLPGQPARIAG